MLKRIHRTPQALLKYKKKPIKNTLNANDFVSFVQIKIETGNYLKCVPFIKMWSVHTFCRACHSNALLPLPPSPSPLPLPLSLLSSSVAVSFFFGLANLITHIQCTIDGPTALHANETHMNFHIKWCGLYEYEFWWF